ncbi:hypothetical protein [Bradyrhizobium sp. LHD-71]|uniref:hypothetical protein n=1 Tax=Bradyrhizobium sp. LHD-71 TaxID=3072141 RepID=UPI00280EFEE7|nr:hypothetical protein [Bradyrhizobium sp. LHD-71]MDQ8730494.1 hypothetical protein [Bradyrhizobium sp. LHD-71]
MRHHLSRLRHLAGLSVCTVNAIFGVFWVASAIMCLAAILYAATIIWSALKGDALPTGTVVGTWPLVGRVWDLSPFSSHAIFASAAIGCALAWFASTTAPATKRYRVLEERITAFWTWAAWPLVSLLMLFQLSGGGWAGRYSPHEMHYMSIAGLIPYSDARTYYSAPFESIYEGAWNWIAAQRPLAAAFRTVLVVLSANSYTTTIVVQTLLLGFAIVLSARSVAKSYGPWVALGFTGLAIGLARPFLPTMLTESLGLFWALISLALFLQSFRLRSELTCAFGYAALCLGLLTRMGSMFTIPTVAIWMVAAFGKPGQRVRFLAVSLLAFASVLGMSYALGLLFSTSPGNLGGNFSYTLCGLARGTSWLECKVTFASELNELSVDPAAQNALLRNIAITAIVAQPTILLSTLYETMYAYVENIPRFFIVQYGALFWPPHIVVQLTVLALLPGWIYFVFARKRLLETTFFLTVLASVILSAAIAFRDDGGRVLTVTHPFVALILALGLSSPTNRTDPRPTPESWQPLAAGLVVASLLIIVPVIVRLSSRPAERVIAINSRDASSPLVLSRPALTGFLVQPNGSPLRRDVPSLHQSALEAIVERTGIEKELGPFVAAIAARVPVALVYAPRFNGPASTNLFIVPEEVLTRNELKAWQFELDTGEKQSEVSIVKRATPRP